jgi:NADH-quinone oxidoreductase subunit N
MNIDFRDLLPLLPVIIYSVGAIVLMISEASLKGTGRTYQAALAAITALLGAIPGVKLLGGPVHASFGGVIAGDGFAGFVIVVVAAGLFLTELSSATFLGARQSERGEYHALLLFAAAGMDILAVANDLMMIFIGIEVMSVAVYALAAYLRRGTRPSEAAMKYFLLGAVASAIFVFGTALMYGATHGTGLRAIARAAGAQGLGVTSPLGVAGLVLVATGFAFKVAAVPTHMWLPDVYEGAPTPVTAFMAAGVKTAAFASLFRTVATAFPGPGAISLWLPLLSWAAILTMIGGNLLALPQRNVKRMLAYSSVAHAGYLLVGVCAMKTASARADAGEGLLFYLAAYTLAVVGAFSVLVALEKRDTESATAWDIDRFMGLSRRHPYLALAGAVFMLSLAGIPPTIGFPAKVLLFKAAVEADLIPLAIVGLVASAAGAYYYLRVVVYMYMRESEDGEVVPVIGWPLGVALAMTGVAIVVLGVGPSFLVELARASGATFSG